MRTIIQHRDTQQFLAHPDGPGSWTQRADGAVAFASSVAALQFCLKNHLENVQIVLKFQRDEFDIRLPVRTGPAPRTGI